MAKLNLIALAFAAALSGTTALAQMPAIQEQAEKGFVFGKVTDKAGNPLGGVQMFIDGIGDNNMQVTTKADGTYRARLAFGAYRALATLEKEYDGQTFKIELKPDTTDSFDAEDGAVRNFIWELTGKKPSPGMGTYGAYLYVNVSTDNMYVEDTENLTYTLTPVGPLIDGSTGQTIVRQGGEAGTEAYGKILDIPTGRYIITGTYSPPGKKAQTLRFKNNWDRKSPGYVESLEFSIKAEGNYCTTCASIDVESPMPEGE
ncbi:hypothetical protein sos41_10370 [Alphaproteobacteria bacterium SO-S41]|nr:hypothetical protein sos41_10370 [Alphaproteobacteria bacterium SO-S41]